MAQCRLCNNVSSSISRELGICLKCIRERPGEARPIAMEAHSRNRAAFGLPGEPPRDRHGLPCDICVNECRIPDGRTGYCGVRINAGGAITGVSAQRGKLSWYHDPLPTNCVADWVCSGGTGIGYPKFANSSCPEYGYKNLAVFFHACTFNCLYCQNWHFRNETFSPHSTTVEELIADVDEKTSCICFFGGDPSPHLPFSLHASRLAIEEKKGNILRICWETNGSMHAGLLESMVELALESGGCIKFDIKAWDENLHVALTGITNRRTLENFRAAAKRIRKRPVPPLLIANTLLVPGYIDEVEVRSIAAFIASIDPKIPYSLLAFYPHFYMSDMPMTQKALAESCLKAAQEEGLVNVRIGNIHLLTP